MFFATCSTLLRTDSVTASEHWGGGGWGGGGGGGGAVKTCLAPTFNNVDGKINDITSIPL